MSQPVQTPAWGTPVNPVVMSTSLPAATSVDGGMQPPSMPPTTVIDPGSGDVQLRVTALHFALKVIGDRGTMNTRDHAASVRKLASELEQELLTGRWRV